MGIRNTALQQYNASFVNVAWPSGTLAGDTVVMLVETAYNTSTPSGWTNVYGVGGTAANGLIIYRTLTAGDITTGYVTVGAAGSYFGVAVSATWTGPATVTASGGSWSAGSSPSVTLSSGLASGYVAIHMAGGRNNQAIVPSRGSMLQSNVASEQTGALYAETLSSTASITTAFNTANTGNGVLVGSVVLVDFTLNQAIADSITISDLAARTPIFIPAGIRGLDSVVYAPRGNFNCVFPPGTQVGDTALIQAAFWGANTPSGWTQLYAVNGTLWESVAFWKVLTSGDVATGSVTMGQGGSYYQASNIVVFIGSMAFRETITAYTSGNSFVTSSSVLSTDVGFGLTSHRSPITFPVYTPGVLLDADLLDGFPSAIYSVPMTSGVNTIVTNMSTDGNWAGALVIAMVPPPPNLTQAISESISILDSIATGITSFVPVVFLIADSLGLADSPVVSFTFDRPVILPSALKPFEFYGMETPADVEILPVPKKYDQIGPVRFDKIGKIFGFRVRMIASGITTMMPYKIFGDDSESLDHLNSPLFFDSFAVRPGLDNVYEIQLPKSVNTDICRMTFGPVDDPFYRYDVLIKVHISGMKGQAKWIPIR